MARFSLRWMFVGVAVLAAYFAALADSSEVASDAVSTGLSLTVTAVVIYALITRTPFSLGFSATAIVYWLHKSTAYVGHGYEGTLSPHAIRWLLSMVHGDLESNWQPLTGVFAILESGWLLAMCALGGWFASWLAARLTKR